MNKINMFIKNQKPLVRRRFSIVNFQLSFIICMMAFSCNFLDIVPDNIPTIDHAFRNRIEAQSYLYGLLGGMPDVGNVHQDPALAGSDEIWVQEITYIQTILLRRILIGEQSPINPRANYWSSKQNNYDLNGGKALWTTIADCNVFLENIHLPFDLLESERDFWKGEALFVKAYLHFWLFRQYGPIPLIRENLSINTGTDEIMRYREPVDEVCDYIVSLLDEAIDILPHAFETEVQQFGRPNKCIAAALKAQVLALAASPLFNCNPDFADYKDNRGIQLFPQDKSKEKEKWERAAEATKYAIDLAEEGLHCLYDARTDYQYAGQLSDETLFAMQVRGAATEAWNPEIIWGNSRTNTHQALQRFCCPYFNSLHGNGSAAMRCWAPPLHVVEQFYTKNGLPIEDDAEWTGRNLWAMRTATADDRQYIRQGRETVELHFDREPRFYGSICFDQGTFFGSNWLLADNTANAGTLFVTEFMFEQLNGFNNPNRSTLTGYICKKLLNFRSSAPLASSSWSTTNYAFPIIRLADLYLLYAEALNESLDAPDQHEDVYKYIDLVRERYGLEGVVKSWSDHAVDGKKNLPAGKEGMRDIILRERSIELAFEGHRFWDMQRHKRAHLEFTTSIQGWSYLGTNFNDFFVLNTNLQARRFGITEYLWPIRLDELNTNANLVQNPGW